MSIGSEYESDGGVVNEINMTPLIDVMLVLLIIFIVTLPVINGAVKVDLPKAVNKPVETVSRNVDISIDAAGTIYWDKIPTPMVKLNSKVAVAAAVGEANAPTVRIYADRNVRYDVVANVLSALQNGGLGKIDFVTDLPQTQ
ncbi:ExbD/TolR family protein [Paraburkholderia kururiensis]|uniref:ExbD/TolR family protein n=1 Tax=Paraburkholderia kururiensis TaxID=984307 RepID=UPI000476E142|nr:biopolymer transporter ExbD [Paraburkholderia kururiensis]